MREGIEEGAVIRRTLGGGCCDIPAKAGLPAEEVDDFAAMLKALGHPVRLQIVELLSRYGGQVCVCDIESRFDLSQPTISHHLKILRKARLVASEQRGLWVYYFLHGERFGRLAVLLEGMRGRESATGCE